MSKFFQWLGREAFSIFMLIAFACIGALLILSADRATREQEQVIRDNPQCVILDRGSKGYFYMMCQGTVQIIQPREVK
jgi:hypothetical protein